MLIDSSHCSNQEAEHQGESSNDSRGGGRSIGHATMKPFLMTLSMRLLNLVQRLSTRTRLAALAVLIAIPVAGLLIHVAKAAPVDGFTLPCSPYYVGGYHFGEYAPERVALHAGEDIACKAGAGVYAAANGTVVYSARTPDSYRWGNLIVIEHTNPPGNGKTTTLYGHLSNARQVSVGQEVSKGQLIGFVGPSYTAENGNWANHLHFQAHLGTYPETGGAYSTDYNRGYVPEAELNRLLNPTSYVYGGLQSYGGAGTAVTGNRQIYYNDQTTFSFRVRNTGSYTWETSGPNAVKLGTYGPKDRGSGFSGGSGWTSPARIALTNQTATGDEGTFTATFPSNHQPGNYRECFAPVKEGVTWIDSGQICVDFTVLPPGYRGQFISQQVSTVSSPTDLSNNSSVTYLRPGDTRNFKVLIKNTGELPWEVGGNNPVRLAGSRPQDRGSGFATISNSGIPPSENWLSSSRASGIDGRYDSDSNSVVSDTQITTGETAVFSYTATTPDAPGERPEYFNPVVEGIGHFADMGIYFPITVADRGYHYQYVSQTITDTQIGGGESTIDYTVRLRNTGAQSWPVNGTLRLGTDRPMGYDSSVYTPSGTGAWISTNRPSTVQGNVTSPGKSTIDTNEMAQFGMRLSIPPDFQPGSYKLFIRPLMENVVWLPEDYGINVPFTVTAKPYDVQFVSQTAPTTLTSGTPSSTGTITLKNTGRVTWSSAGANPLRLGTEAPKDRVSRFFTSGQGWLSPTRIALAANATDSSQNGPPVTVKPGENGRFNITFSRGTTPAGSYQERFTPVAEGREWLTDLGIYLPVVVQ